MQAQGTLRWDSSPTTLAERVEALRTLSHVRAIHSLLAGAANRLDWRVLRGDTTDEIESRLLDAYAGIHFADWMVLGEAWIGSAWMPTERGNPNALHIQHPSPPLLSAGALLQKLRQLERAQLQALWRWGASVFIAPTGEGDLIPTPQEREAAREALHAALREAGVGGIEFLPYRMEFVELKTKPADYEFHTLTTQYIRELCNLFGVDSSLLNDPENKTYSNKTEAQKALYVNVIIPNAYLFAELLNRELILRHSAPYPQVAPDPSNLEPLAEDRERQAAFLLQLYREGVITLTEIRQKLGYDTDR